MANGIKSYEDWTPPEFLRTEDDKDVDMDRVRYEFYRREKDNAKYRRVNTALRAQVDELKDDDGGESQSDEENDGEGSEPKPKKKKQDSEAGGQGSSLNETRLEIALERGLTKNQAMRLHGSTKEELEADADAYMEEHGMKSDDGKEEEEEATPPPTNRPKRGEVRSGSERGDQEPTSYDPNDFLESV